MWVCIRKSRVKKEERCQATARTVGNYLVATGDHTNHFSDINKNKVDENRRGIKRKVWDSPTIPTREALDEYNRRIIDPGMAAAAAKQKSVQRMVQRTKAQALGFQQQPASLEELANLPEDATITLQGDRFLLFNNTIGDQSSKRMIIWGSSHGQKMLCISDLYVSDGTFQTSPEFFEQIYLLLAKVSLINF